MSEELGAQIAQRAAGSGISERTARLLITGRLSQEVEILAPDHALVRERAGLTDISTRAAGLLMSPLTTGLGLLAPREAGSAPQ
jgi:hypothetical protein